MGKDYKDLGLFGRKYMEEQVYELLNKLNIKYEKIEHPALFTAEDNDKYNIKIDAKVCKNLFIKNSNKTNYYLVALPLEKKANFKALQELLEETRLSFVQEEVLQQKLGVKHGSVSIFNVTNLKDKDIVFILDKEILQYEKIGFHPNINTATVIFNPKELYKIFDYYNVKYKFMDI